MTEADREEEEGEKARGRRTPEEKKERGWMHPLYTQRSSLGDEDGDAPRMMKTKDRDG